jgi:aspartate aminotransferase
LSSSPSSPGPPPGDAGVAGAFRPAARLGRVSVSPILALSAKAAALKAEGRAVIDLTVGEPDFDTPAAIKAAAAAAMAAGQTKYTLLPGSLALRTAILERTIARHDAAVTLENVAVCNGAKQVIHNALAATLDEGDEVILPVPYWTSYADMIALEGGRAVPAAGVWDARRGWRIDPVAVEAAIGPRTRWLLLNSPSNPSGSMMDAAERDAIAEVLARHPQVWLLSDDIYEDIAYAPHPPSLARAPHLADRTLLVSGVSKAYAMTGWRIGWGVGPAPLIRAMMAVQSQTTSAPCSISQAAAVEAIRGSQAPVAAMVGEFRARRDAVVARLAAIDGLVCPAPDGAFYVFPLAIDLIGRRTPDGDVITSDTELCRYLLEQAGVALVPGSAFGCPGHFRLSFAASQPMLDEAVDRIAAAVSRLDPTHPTAGSSADSGRLLCDV